MLYGSLRYILYRNMKPFGKKRAVPRVGVHTSIAGGVSKAVERAVSLRANTLQMFSHNPRQWRNDPVAADEARRFMELRRRHDIGPVFVHASYLINLASASDTVRERSVEFLSYELTNADMLGAEYVVLHTGSAGSQSRRTALSHAVAGITRAAGKNRFSASILLENTAGEKGDITSSISALAELIDKCRCRAIAGVCIDTCHAFSSGYDLASYDGIGKLLSEIERYIGLERLKLIHLNDSKRPCGAGVDRHEHIGKGHIGAGGFRKMLSDSRIEGVPLILETPKSTEEDDRTNLRTVRRILSKLT